MRPPFASRLAFAAVVPLLVAFRCERPPPVDETPCRDAFGLERAAGCYGYAACGSDQYRLCECIDGEISATACATECGTDTSAGSRSISDLQPAHCTSARDDVPAPVSTRAPTTCRDDRGATVVALCWDDPCFGEWRADRPYQTVFGGGAEYSDLGGGRWALCEGTEEASATPGYRRCRCSDVDPSLNALTQTGSGNVGVSAVAYRAQRFRVAGRDVNIAYVWVDLRSDAILVETNAQSFRGSAARYVSNNPRALVAMNANFFDWSNSACTSPTWNVVGLAMSAGRRFAPGSEFALGNRFSLTCDYSNYCIPQPYTAELDRATRAGTSRWQNIVSGGQRIVHRGQAGCTECDSERDAQVAVGLSGQRADGGFASLFMVVSEGSETFGRGLTLRELAEWMASHLRVQEAIQLDGGGSSQIAVEGFRDGRRGGLQLNHPKYPICYDPLVRASRDVPALLTVRLR